MARYNRSAEDAFMRSQARAMHRPTGDIFEEGMRTHAFRCLAGLNHIRETANKNTDKKTLPIRVYPYMGYKKDANDEWNGTDLKLVDYAGVIAPFAGHLRMDFTHNFQKKLDDYMPILAEPHEKITCCGKPVRFGIRVGNRHGMFREPVIVVGIDALPSEVKSMAETSRLSELNSQMTDIIYSSGKILQEFMRQADPDFKAFMDKYPKSAAYRREALGEPGQPEKVPADRKIKARRRAPGRAAHRHPATVRP